MQPFSARVQRRYIDLLLARTFCQHSLANRSLFSLWLCLALARLLAQLLTPLLFTFAALKSTLALACHWQTRFVRELAG